MGVPDHAAARRYALERLARELSPLLTYHSLAHTRDDVAPAAERLAVLAGIDGEALELLQTAACFHDLGFVEQRHEHELAGVRLAWAALPGFGFEPAQIEAITGMIMATRLPQTPRTPLEALLADADLDVLGRDDFWARTADLRAEWAAYGQPYGDLQWLQSQLAFQQGHEYFTQAARRLRGATKQANIERLKALIAACEGSDST